ncbi:MAG: glycosyltransferase family 2 protein [Candidatus Korarchaeum sp.]
MLTISEFVELSLLLMTAYSTLNLLRSSVGILRLPRAGESYGGVMISVVIPARNEEGRLGECLESVLPQLSESDELIMVNDCSTDSTELEALEKLDERCKLITLLQKPDGWTGKSWACYQGYLHSSGDVIVFMDADTKLRGSLREAISLMRDYDAVSQVPRIRCGSLVCGAVEVALVSLIRLFFPYWGSRAWLMGAFMIWRREAYESVGTHASVKSSLVEDADLARLALKMGMKVSFFLGGIAESCWVNSWKEAYWAIKRISLGASAGRHVSFLAFLLLTYASLTIYLSPAMAILGRLDPAIVSIYLLSVLSYASLSIIEVRANPCSFILAPLALPLIGLALIQASEQHRIEWRGRVYSTAEEGTQ